VETTPAGNIRFYRDDEKWLTFSARQLSPAWKVGTWLLNDVQGDSAHLLEILDGIQAVRSGTGRPYETSGNAWFMKVDGDQVVLENHFNEKLNGTVSVDEVLIVLRAYWDALGEAAMATGRERFVQYEKREPNLPW
jgi:uncharacterized protein YacL (UPF0231 family)